MPYKIATKKKHGFRVRIDESSAKVCFFFSFFFSSLVPDFCDGLKKLAEKSKKRRARAKWVRMNFGAKP